MNKLANKLHSLEKKFVAKKHRVNTVIKASNANRLIAWRTNMYNYLQIVAPDGTVLAAANDCKVTEGTKKEKARKVGQAIAKIALEKGISNVVFDRNGFLYHGRIKEMADGAREAGLTF